MKTSTQALIERASLAKVENAFAMSCEVRFALLKDLPAELREQLEALLPELEDKTRRGPWLGGSTFKA